MSLARTIARRAGNRALGAWLGRDPQGRRALQRVPGGDKGGSGGTGGRRTIVIDGNILDEIHRGNKKIADKLRDFAANHDVWIAHQAYQEKVVNRRVKSLATADDLILKELNIRVTPAPPQETIDAVAARNTYPVKAGTKTVLSKSDVRVAASAVHLKGEVWSVDGVFADNTNSVRNTVGVPVAPESQTIRGLGHPKPKQDYQVGLRLITGDEFVIAPDGKVTSRTKPGGGTTGGGTTGGGGGTGTGGTTTTTNTKSNTKPTTTPPDTTGTKPPPRPPVDERERSRRATRAKFLAGEAIQALNRLFNWVIDTQNRYAIEAAYEAEVANWERAMHRDPTQGLLIPLRFVATQPGVAGRFKGLGAPVPGRNEAEARKAWNSTPRYETGFVYQFHYLEPLDPQGVAPGGWEPYAVGKFADITKIRYQRVKFAQIGGLGLKGQTEVTDWTPKRSFAEAFRFTILRPPSELTYAYGAPPARKSAKKSVTVQMRQVSGRKSGVNVPALIIEGVPVLAVVSRDSLTEQAFQLGRAWKEIDDKEWSLDASIRGVRFLRLDQVAVVDLLDEAAQREEAAEEELMEIVKDPSKRPDFGGPKQPTGEPDSLEWDRYKGEWKQRKKVHR